MEELAEIGITNFLRVGTTGAIQPQVKVGDIVITKAAVRIDGTSEHYAPMEYPAVASFDFSACIVEACREIQTPYHVGITASSASFYPGQDRYDSFKGFVPRKFRGLRQEWQHLNVLNYEMESAAVFTIASTFGLRAACFCVVLLNRLKGEHAMLKPFAAPDNACVKVMRRALELDIARTWTIIGLTGGIGSGKSAVANILAQQGVDIIDTDQIARDIVLPQEPAYEAIVDHFGSDILHDDKKLNRRALRKHIFEDEAQRLWLEALLHPQIRVIAEQRVKMSQAALCVVVIPLLKQRADYPYLAQIWTVEGVG